MDAYTRISGYTHAMRELSDIFKALGDETRLAILALLLEHGELCVCDIEGVIGASQSKTSRHLRYLLHAGLVQDRREGIWMHYSIPRSEDGPRGNIRRMLKRVLTPELTAALNARFTKQCCVDGVCVPASARAKADAAK
jgi:ArsR family transcriptional regulator, arsenate/arsenite/antimonite-responsive transcriptional repressor